MPAPPDSNVCFKASMIGLWRNNKALVKVIKLIS